MAKRRRLETPSAEDLTRIEEEFRRETSARPPLAAPIAQVAAESAAATEVASPEERADRARDKADAERLRQAEAGGLVIAEIPIAEIDADAMIRDRTVMDSAEMEELKLSIAASGLRLPIEVFELTEPSDSGARYGLISGYRRILAVRELHALTAQPKHGVIRALVRPRRDADAAFAEMVEENEVRAALSHFERGRIAVIAAKQGAFSNVEEAVNRLFPAASRAKRSKVRSFASVFEELGDLLAFPESLTEKRGLRLANALRDGAESRLRQALEAGQGTSPELEWDVMEPIVEEVLSGPRDVRRGGRPRRAAPPTGWTGPDTIRTSTGVTITRSSDGDGYIIRLQGRKVDTAIVESLMIEIRNQLEKP